MFPFQFIFYYFVHIAKLKNIFFLHCSAADSLLHFAHLVQNETLYTQYLDINMALPQMELMQDMFFNHKLIKLGIYLDINCIWSHKVLDMASTKRLFSERYHWLIYDRSFNFTQLQKRFSEAQLFLNTELTYVNTSSKTNSFILYDLFNKAKHLGGKLNITIDQEIVCNEQQCQVRRYLSDLYKRTRLQHRKFLTGLSLKLNAAITTLPIDTPEADIKAFLSSHDDIYKDPFARLSYQSFETLKDMLQCNFNYSFRDRWTDSDVTGGLIRDLINGRVDLTASAFLYTTERGKYLKPLTWHCSFRSICMFLNPSSSGADFSISQFLQPFSWTVWFMLVAMLILAGCLLWLTFQLERRLSDRHIKPSLLTSFLLSFGAACIQGAWLLPRSTGGRMVFYAVMLTCFLLYNYYTSIVVSTLLGATPKSSIRSVQQLADSNLEVAVEPTIYTKVYLETSDYPHVISLYHKKILQSPREPQRIWMPSEKGVLMVKNQPGFVYIAEAASAYFFVRKHFLPHEICELNEILLMHETSAHTMLPKNSSFVELVKLSQLRMLETGVHLKHFRYWIRSTLYCYPSNRKVVVGIGSTGPLFLLLLCAYIICLFVLGLEVLWHRRQLHAVSSDSQIGTGLTIKELCPKGAFSPKMQLLQLGNFLLHNLLQYRISFIVFFHCWHRNESLQLAQHIHSNPHQLIYHQFVHFNNDWNGEHLEERYLDHLQPTLAIYVDLKCVRSKDLLAEASRTRLFNQHYHWLLHDSVGSFEFYRIFESFNISVDADVSHVQQKSLENDVLYGIHDVYSNGNHIGGQLNITGRCEILCNSSRCQLRRYLSTLHLRSKYRHREQLTDVVMRVATVVTKRPISWPPEILLNYLTQVNNTHIDAIARFGFQLCLLIKDLLQCDMNFTFTDRWSTSDVAGGSVGAVVDQTADIGSAPCLATDGRLRRLSAIIETGYFRSVCLFRTPHNAGIRGDVFLQPFSPLVWYLFAGILLLISLLLWFTFYMECKRMRRRWRLHYIPSLVNTWLITFGAACIQSSSLTPRSTGGRLAYFALFLVSFIMYNYYTSVVVSSLLNSPVKSNIKTVQQLAESSLTVGLEPLTFTKSYLNYSQRPEIHLFAKRKIETQSNNPDLWLPAEEGIIRVRDNPGYVFVLEASSGYAYVEQHYTQQQICDLNEIMFRPELLLYTHLHRNSTYKELVRLKLLRVLETGVYRKHRNEWARMKLHCYSQNFAITVGMEYVAPLFFMLICGYILVLVLLLLELAWQRFIQRSY